MACNLYTWANNTSAQAIQVTATLSSTSLNSSYHVPGSVPEGFPKFATGPCLTTAEGQKLTQYSAILSHVGKVNDVNVIEWISFAQNQLTPSASAWVFPTLGAMPNNKGAINQGKQALLATLSDMNNFLACHTWLAGERPSAADAACVAALVLTFKQVLAPEYRKDIPHVVRWFQTAINQSAFCVFGKIDLCDKEAQFDGKTFGELNKASKGAGNQSPKQQKKKAEKPKSKPPTKVPVEVIGMAAPDKKKDPWAGLGGNMDMDAWKRCYSNNDTIPTAMDYFWKHLDQENYSVYFGKYMYGGEIAQAFMATNLIRGFFQRIDKMRKNSFSSLCVFGEKKGEIEISGVWFWKGQGLAFELSDDWKVDYDTYEWSKMDMNNENDKKKVQEYFAWEGDFDGKKFYDGKIFK